MTNLAFHPHACAVEEFLCKARSVKCKKLAFTLLNYRTLSTYLSSSNFFTLSRILGKVKAKHFHFVNSTRVPVGFFVYICVIGSSKLTMFDPTYSFTAARQVSALVTKQLQRPKCMYTFHRQCNMMGLLNAYAVKSVFSYLDHGIIFAY